MKKLITVLCMALCLGASGGYASAGNQEPWHLSEASAERAIQLANYPEVEVLLVIEEDPETNGVFLPPGCYLELFQYVCVEKPTLVAWLSTQMPELAGWLVIFHEFGHYEQHRVGSVQSEIKWYELEADALAVQRLCELGYDGERAVREWAWYQRNIENYFGDEDHGTLDQRERYAIWRGGAACRARKGEQAS